MARHRTAEQIRTEIDREREQLGAAIRDLGAEALLGVKRSAGVAGLLTAGALALRRGQSRRRRRRS